MFVAKDQLDFETSLTLDYRKEKWTLDRVVLDIVSNHLPADSKGTKVDIHYQQGGEWIPFREKKDALPIDAVRIADDGKGFDHRLLNTLYSDKTLDIQSVGQFGEGLKLGAAGCLRLDERLSFHSRDWEAVPYAKDEMIEERKIQRLGFKGKKGLTERQGSMSLFEKPSNALIREIDNLPTNILYFNDDMVEHYTREDWGYKAKILTLKGKKQGFFVKGVRMKRGLSNLAGTSFIGGAFGLVESIYSYDTSIRNISPDREVADSKSALRAIRDLLLNCDNEEVINTILARAKDVNAHLIEFAALNFHETPIQQRESKYTEYYRSNTKKTYGNLGSLIESYNCNSIGLAEKFGSTISIENIKKLEPFREEYTTSKYNQITKFEDTWGENVGIVSARVRYREAFEKMYGKEAVLHSSDSNHNTDAILMGFPVVVLQSDIRQFLKRCGVPEANELLSSDTEFDWVDPSDYTPDEKKLIEQIPELMQYVSNKPAAFNFRVYDKLYCVTKDRKSGNVLRKVEVQNNGGIHYNIDPVDPSKKLLALHRSTFALSPSVMPDLEFRKVFFHELGHDITDADDNDRRFTDFFVQKLAEESYRHIPYRKG